MQLYHEATLCNLLEVLLYHASICEVGGDAMLELGDYCVRKVNLLNAGSVQLLQCKHARTHPWRCDAGGYGKECV